MAAIGQLAAGVAHDNLAPFPTIARALAELGVDRCVFSFAQLYGKVLPIHYERAGMRADEYLD